MKNITLNAQQSKRFVNKLLAKPKTPPKSLVKAYRQYTRSVVEK